MEKAHSNADVTISRQHRSVTSGKRMLEERARGSSSYDLSCKERV